jgi:uncharacterized protein (TIGR00251 family)
MTWLCDHDGGALLSLHIQPGAKKTEVCGLYAESLKIRLTAPPVDGKANDALIGFLANTLGLPRSRLTLVSGQASRSKRVAIAGVTIAEVEEKLIPAIKVG